VNRIALLKNRIQEYAWGSKTFIPELLGSPAPAENPQAELWMGIHPNGPSMVSWKNAWIPLRDLIEKDPESVLGKSVAGKFSNTLPFLFKILAANRPLSIQAHPSLNQAREGFAKENRLQIPLTASHRNYKDNNHKPEILCALSHFWALKGFRKVEEIFFLVDKIGISALESQIAPFRKRPNSAGLKAFFSALMTIKREQQSELISAIVETIGRLNDTHPAYEWMIKLHQTFPGDIGVLAPVFLNLVRLQPGEAIYLPAGELHGYLEGAAIELMANSDNVLRGGLTPKHVDAPELLRTLNFEYGEANILDPESRRGAEWLYPAPVEEFALSQISLHEGSAFKSEQKRSVEIMICVEGRAHIKDAGSRTTLALERGTAIIIPAVVKQYQIEGKATIYKAAVPL
jgi:mannose-6-phosphate isomerase